MSECLSHDLSSFFFFQKLVALIVQQTRTLYTVQYSTIYIVGVSVILFYGRVWRNFTFAVETFRYSTNYACTVL